MKPSSVISLVIAVLITIVGMVTCFVAQNMAKANGVALFTDYSDGTSTITETFNPENLEKISLVFSSGIVNIYGNCDIPGSSHYSENCKLELVNFGESDYVLTPTSTKLELNETIALDRFKFWENGFSFKGMRYILDLNHLKALLKKDNGTDDRIRQINLYLTKDVTPASETVSDNLSGILGLEDKKEWALKQIEIKATSAKGCDVNIQDIALNTDYSIMATNVRLHLKNVTTNSSLRMTEGPGGSGTQPRSALIGIENSSLTYLTASAHKMAFRSSGLSFFTSEGYSDNLKLTCETGSGIYVGLNIPGIETNCDVRTSGRILVDNDDKSRPYTYVVGVKNPTINIKCGDMDVSIQADASGIGNFMDTKFEAEAAETGSVS